MGIGAAVEGERVLLVFLFFPNTNQGGQFAENVLEPGPG